MMATVCGAAGAAAGDRHREGLGALVVGPGAAALPPVGGVEGLVQGAGGPALADRGQVHRADGQRVSGAGTAERAAGGCPQDQVETGAGGGVGRGVGDHAAALGGGQFGQGGVVGVHRGASVPGARTAVAGVSSGRRFVA